MKKLVLLAILTGFVPVLNAQSGGGNEFTKTAQAVAMNHAINVGEYERFSIQVDYTAVRPATSTVAAGTPSSLTLTVADYAALAGAQATATITLADGKNTSAIDGAIIRVNGKTFTEGVDWDRLATSTMTMASLKDAIDAWNTEYSASVSSNVVTITAAAKGTAANSWTLTTSTGVLAASGANFASGQAHGYFMVNYVNLVEGTDWTSETSSATTAGNIAAAINANSTLANYVSASTTSLGVVTITSLTNGVNDYPVSVSNASALVPSNSKLVNGVASDISVADDTFYEASHGYSTGLAVLFSTVANSTPPTGLTIETTYYAIPVNANYYKLATSTTNAVAGTDVDITALPTSGTYDIKPLAFVAGSAAFKLQASNDGTDWADISGASVSYSADGTYQYTNSDYGYKYIRVAYTAPTSGGITLDCNLHWRK